MTPKPKTIQDWSLDYLFDTPVLRGEVDGVRICAPWTWWARERFGICRGFKKGTDQVLRQACQAAATWLAAGHEIRVAFNAPPQWLNAAAIVAVEQAIADFGIPPAIMTVEVTEMRSPTRMSASAVSSSGPMAQV